MNRAWLPLALALVACVEVPDRRQSGGPAPGPDGAVFAPDRGPDMAVREPPDVDVDPEVDAGPDTVRDQGPDAAPEGPCPTPCPAATQMAAYAPLDRVDALHVLDDGSVLVAGRVEDADALGAALQMRGMDPTYIDLDGGDLRAPEGPDVVLMHLSPDLTEVRVVSTLLPGTTGAIVDIQGLPDGSLRLVTSHGAGRVVDGMVDDNRGYALITLRRAPIADGRELTLGTRVIPAAGVYQEVPPVAFGADGSAGAVLGSPWPPAVSTLLRLGPDLAPMPMDGWRHHVLPGPMAAFGPKPATALYSTVPLTVGDRCTLRTTTDEPGALQQLYVTPQPDGNGGRRLGWQPFDNFAGQPCPTPPVPEQLAPVGQHGWAMTTGLPVDVSGVVLADDGALVVGFDAEAHAGDDGDRVPAVIAYDADGGLRWWQRLHRDAIEVDPARVSPVAAPTDQEIAALALDRSDPERPAVVVAARGVPNDPHPLWLLPPGPDGTANPEPFQGQPRAAGVSSVGWLGRLSLVDGSLEAATWIYRVNAEPTPERMRPGRLRCFIDEALTDAAPQPVSLARGRLAVGPQGQVAVAGVGFGLSTTPDALQAIGAPPDQSIAAAFVRIYDRDLTTVLYATALSPVLPDGALGTVRITDLAFTADGDLLVSGDQLAGEGDSGQLPTVGAPPWADDAWPAEAQVGRASRGFVARLVPRPLCGE